MNKSCVTLLLFLASLCHSTSIITAEAGSFKLLDPDRYESEDLGDDFHFDFTLNAYYGWDQMVLLGIGAGYQQIGVGKSFPLMTHLFVRLPIGSLILPIVQGSWGYQLGEDSSFFYRLGGGIDMRLGDRSSLILMAGTHNYLQGHHSPRLFLRGGLLLEF